jgi:hypothetical protein
MAWFVARDNEKLAGRHAGLLRATDGIRTGALFDEKGFTVVSVELFFYHSFAVFYLITVAMVHDRDYHSFAVFYFIIVAMVHDRDIQLLYKIKPKRNM